MGKVVTPEEGVKNQLWAVAGAKREALVNGAFYMPVGQNAQRKLTKMGKSESFAKEVWEWTDGALKEFL